MFILYQSALACAKIDFEKKLISIYDPYQGKYLEFTPITKTETSFLKTTWRIDLDEVQSRLQDFLPYIGQNSFTINEQAHYQKINPNFYGQRSQKFPLDITTENGEIVAFTVPAREEIVTLVKEGKEALSSLDLWKNVPIAQYDFSIKRIYNIETSMRDGVILRGDLYLPQNNQTSFSTVLIRTCYDKDKIERMFLKYARRGFAVFIQDVRGREQSEGKFQKFLYETDDGSDTLDWIAQQEWCNGQIGMTGGSYLGYVQWAAASTGNPHLKAITSFVTAGDSFKDNPRKGGALMSCVTSWFFSMVDKKYKPENMRRDDWDELLEIRPLQDLYKKAFGTCPYFVEEYLSHKHYDEFWDKINWHSRKDQINVPALVVSGWFDDNGAGTTDALDIINTYPAEQRKVILGAWQHSGNSTRDLNGVAFGNNCVRYDIDIYIAQWLDIHLNHIPQNLPNNAPVEYYTGVSNIWKTAENWPLPHAQNTKYYLESNGSANSSIGDGKLTTTEPTNNKDSYIYDPNNPAINLIDLSENEGAVPANYTEEELRKDIVCYTSDVLANDLTISGDIIANLYVSADVPDTDFVVRVLDVDENGSSLKIADGILTAKYREGFNKEVFFEKDQVSLLSIQTSKISWTLKKGHRLRFHITSSAKNFIFPHSNTKDAHNSIDTVIAKISIHHGVDNPSHIIVPIEQ